MKVIYLNWFTDIFTKFDWANLFSFIVGMVFGFLICLLVYALIIVTDIKKQDKKASKVVIKVDDEKVNALINNEKNRYKLEASSLKASDKVKTLSECITELVYDIAKTYFPESKHPVYELTVEEIINLDYYIMHRIEEVFDRKVVKKIKKLRLVTIFNMIDKKKAIEENKAVKAASKVAKPAKGIWNFLKVINPVKLVKKGLVDAPINLLMNKIAIAIVDIVGDETSKVYSKSVFVKVEDEVIYKEIEELEKEMEEEADA